MKKVLIIEDSIIDRKLFVKALSKDTYQLIEMEDAENISDVLLKSEPDIIILDMHLPGLSGFELVKVIKQSTVAPVLCVSSVFIDESSILNGYSQGGIDYMIKPIHPEMLRFKIKNLLDLQEEYFKRIEYQKQTELLAKENQFIEMFIANISHELRTPLNGIMGMLDIMKVEHSIPDYLEDRFDAISESADSLNQIISDILDYTKLKSGNFELSSETFDLQFVCQKIESKFKLLNRNPKVKIDLIIEDGLPKLVRFDLLRLKQILNNLLSNALKFTESGKVSLLVSNKGEHKESCLLEFKVIDTGIGISQEKLPNIFKQFKQIDDRLKKEFIGSGLGLTIVKSLVELSGGEIEVNSILGVGSEFRVVIPFKIDYSNTEVLSADDRSIFDCNVLVVEDVATNQIVAKLMLEKLGCRVKIADNGVKAISMLDEESFDLILMDVQMPVMDGIEATRIIKNGKHKDIKIVGLSANALMQEVNFYREIGMQEFISKPISLSKLLDVFRKIQKRPD